MEKNDQLIFWIIWGSILMSLLTIIQVIAGGFPSGTSKENLDVGLSLAVVLGACISTFIRWNILPKVSKPQPLLVTMIIGLVLAESTGILGVIFIGSEFPSEQRVAIIVSILAALQYIPFYASKLHQ